jgi:hypothetical protein
MEDSLASSSVRGESGGASTQAAGSDPRTPLWVALARGYNRPSGLVAGLAVMAVMLLAMTILRLL